MTDVLDFYALDGLTAVVAVVLIAAASARLTRLVVSDTITRPLVEGLNRRLHSRADDRLEESVDNPSRKTMRKAQRSHAFAEKVEELTSCPWCVSVWTTTALVVAWPWASPSTAWSMVILVLAVAEFAAQVRYRE